MTGKFDKVPVEEDTTVLFRTEAKLGRHDVLYEKWYWDGVTGESIIFANKDVEGLGEEEVKNEVRESPLLKKDSEMTLKRTDTGYTFVNFNFETGKNL